jgi:hypothetical protein
VRGDSFFDALANDHEDGFDGVRDPSLRSE